MDKFRSSIYVDNIVLGLTDEESTYKLYLKSRIRLAEAGFKLRKFVTNSRELKRVIQRNESKAQDLGA